LVKELPQGIHSELGERGARLSGGQIQRIGIARALYRDTPVLILDEATSALDLVTEERILEALHRRESKQTVLVVAHRHSTLKHCDRIYRLGGGRIVESLTYAELQQ
jgi:ATP-binding cassette, subfamily B, bacterial PglK